MKRHPKKVVKKAARAPVVRRGKEPEPHSVVEAEPYSLADTVNEGCLVTGPPDWDRMVATINENAALRAALRVRTNDEEWRMRFFKSQLEVTVLKRLMRADDELQDLQRHGVLTPETMQEAWKKHREAWEAALKEES